ncbi:CRISPR-associated endonuclease Cas1 [Ignatzschineria ureiclastica]|uniref:CRISPR-associated endonuclease Cas1 n=1 Tax=Ignatzschineria ureiclastica TaxID=472582 RepID=A0A2U2AEY1_9GAMM|nr:CRISPR-associated endonuclease Cas1 [Ignatzschineria ureiclastica]PWD81222.1 CRISPR-associated endonuclease Cas1 [Ignatzschineria ureiclastica]GGZ97246.1 CRISPR-associated endonuclease Cas1 1 [Ignatzschineria ureiclastica]
MTCLYLDKRGLTLKSEGNVLVVFGESGRIATVPLEIVERICIKGSTQLSASLLAKLGEKDIAVLVLQGLMQKPVMMLPSFRKDALRRQVQYFLSQNDQFALNFSRQIIQRKIESQFEHLIHLSKTEQRDADITTKLQMSQREAFKKLAILSDLEAIRGLEGAMANLYFRSLSLFVPQSLKFKGRNKRPPKDPYNVVLSLGYTLLHAEWVRQIYMMGLDPYIGFLHQPAFGRESLASDLMEPLRPKYDAFALSLFKERVLREEDFSYKEEACKMGKAGRLRFYEAFEIFLKDNLTLIRAQKQLLFAQIEEAQVCWKKSCNLENHFGLFSEQSLTERRI